MRKSNKNNQPTIQDHLRDLAKGAGQKRLAEKLHGRPDIPYDLIHPEVMDKIDFLAGSLNRDMVFCSMLTIIASIIGNSHAVKVLPRWAKSANLWMMIIGKPSVNKTQAIEAALDPVDQLQTRYNTQFEEDLQDYKRAKASHAKKTKQDPHYDEPPPEKPTRTALFINDVTMEKAYALIKNNPTGMLVYNDELASWLGSMNKYRAGADKANWMSLYSGASVAVDRVSKDPLFIPKGSAVSVMGSIQPGVIKTIVEKDNNSDGFASRFCFCWPEDQGSPEDEEGDIDFGMLRAIHNQIIRLVQFCRELTPTYMRSLHEAHEEREISDAMTKGQSRIVKFSPEAKTHYKAWRNHNKELTDAINAQSEDGDPRAAIYGKLHGVSASLCLVLELMEFALVESKQLNPNEFVPEISLANAVAATELTEYFRYTASKAGAKAVLEAGSDNLKAVVEEVARLFHEGLTGRQIAETVNEKIRKNILDPFIYRGNRKDKIDHNWIHRIKKGSEYKHLFAK